MRITVVIPCAHIAAYYEHCWHQSKNLHNTLLWRGYRQWAAGYVEKGNNLFDDSEIQAHIAEHERLHQLFQQGLRMNAPTQYTATVPEDWWRFFADHIKQEERE